MSQKFDFAIRSVSFDEDYVPAENTRITTNFANLARGDSRRDNLRKALRMIDNRFNALAQWDNPTGDRYSVELEIVSVELTLGRPGAGDAFPLIEVLKTTIVDRHAGRRIDGIVGNNFSSYLRDFDFSVVLPEHNNGRSDFSIPADFGDLHGHLFTSLLRSKTYRTQFRKPPVICISASTSRTYHRTDNRHPVMGVEYRQDEGSLTDLYFGKMGMEVRYFMPAGSVAPLAFYFIGDLLSDYSNLELIGTISTMETFQRIYRPEIYNANAAAGAIYRPSLNHHDYSLTRIVYDREERSRLALEQGKFIEDTLIKQHRTALEAWSLSNAA
ncbi:DUF1852 domain-containing protein [Aureimonas altamirensis]|uniref:DUF1852 domain-containing protein n=1 Tax=Aureimonas altamirensis TaxID=370622 RepID=UPI001E2CD902|nr:DUF1852 domain-containing protein [Aureimonas altamirensis]UHD44942.1 DUF1852 domain-containing protein [Aureimonas altamirensis]